MNERGSILISVLWIVLVLSLVSFSLASTVRVEMDSAQQAFDSERALFMARGAAEIVFNSYSKQLPFPADSPVRQEKGEYIFPLEIGEVRVRFESDADRIDINAASDKLLASIFDSLGADRETRNRLVDSILDWIDADDIPHLYGAETNDYPPAFAGQLPRPRNAGFGSVDELLLVRNMTPEIFFGTLVVETATGRYRRIPGLRELVTVRTGSAKVDPNVASLDMLNALPAMNLSTVERIGIEREERLFTNRDDLVTRVPQLFGGETLEYFAIGGNKPMELVSRATIAASGVSRTVRLLLRYEEKTQILLFTPLFFKKIEVITIDRWRFE